MSKISNRKFGFFKNRQVILTTLSSEQNTKVSFMNWGASIQNWIINHPQDGIVSAVLGFEDFEFYPKFSPYFGSIVGRVINRIDKGRFKLNNIEYQLDINRPPNHLHGGEMGFGKQIWDFETNKEDNSVTYSINSFDGEGGYPGEVNAKVKYILKGKTLTIEMSATVDRETPINMGQHNYFNLCSSFEENYNICNHLLYLDSKSYTETDEDLIPTGKIISTQNTEMDFFNKKKIGKIKLDDNYVLEQNNHLIKPAAKLFNPVSNLNLTLWTDQPGIQVYNAPSLNLAPKGLNDVSYGNFSGICLEDQKFPNSVNISDFPSIISSPEKPYFHKTIIEIS